MSPVRSVFPAQFRFVPKTRSCSWKYLQNVKLFLKTSPRRDVTGFKTNLQSMNFYQLLNWVLKTLRTLRDFIANFCHVIPVIKKNWKNVKISLCRGLRVHFSQYSKLSWNVPVKFVTDFKVVRGKSARKFGWLCDCYWSSGTRLQSRFLETSPRREIVSRNISKARSCFWKHLQNVKLFLKTSPRRDVVTSFKTNLQKYEFLPAFKLSLKNFVNSSWVHR